jgi:hypothetical protein
MTRIYDVICCNCGEIMQWCKCDALIENCENCLIALSYRGRWTSQAKIFGVGSSIDVMEYSKPIKDFYSKRFDGVFQNPSHRRGKI